MQLQDVRRQQYQDETKLEAQERLALNGVAAAQAALESAEERRSILIDSCSEVGKTSLCTLQSYQRRWMLSCLKTSFPTSMVNIEAASYCLIQF